MSSEKDFYVVFLQPVPAFFWLVLFHSLLFYVKPVRVGIGKGDQAGNGIPKKPSLIHILEELKLNIRHMFDDLLLTLGLNWLGSD